MSAPDEKINRLRYRLDSLVQTQIDFQKEISSIRLELSKLEDDAVPQQIRSTEQKPDEIPQANVKTPSAEVIQSAPPSESPRQSSDSYAKRPEPPKPAQQIPSFGTYGQSNSETHSNANQFTDKARADLEKFIGENLISKIGIVVLILGVGIGAKYAIDNGWITPLMRIVFGYVVGFALIGIAIRLKEKYLSFSAVLISGGMAIMYFVTYFAYAYYDLISQLSAFALMLMFTIFTVIAALNYSRQVIAHIGLVGAYATPFLLSNDSGNYPFLFSYLMIVNLGILGISIWKYWKPLFYTSFIFTWLIFGGWLLDKYQGDQHFVLGFVFLTLNFLLFYATFIAYRLRSDTNLAIENIGLILTNSFLFYIAGCYLLATQNFAIPLFGLFTIANAFIHFVGSFAVSQFERTSSDVHYLLRSLVFTFITIAIPVQFDGISSVYIWSVMAIMLYVYGRAKKQPLLEIYSLVLFILAGAALFIEWGIFREYIVNPTDYHLITNRIFLGGIIYTACLFAAVLYHKRSDGSSFFDAEHNRVVAYFLGVIGILVLYNTIRFEIANYFYFEALTLRRSKADGFFELEKEKEYLSLLWQIDFSLLYFSLIGLINHYKIRDQIVAGITAAVSVLATVIFVIAGFIMLGELRDSILSADSANIQTTLSNYILLRNVSLIILAVALFCQFVTSRSEEMIKAAKRSLQEIFECYFSFIVVIVLSSELVNWTAIFGIQESYKYGLSILWGIIALALISIGIYQKKKHLRFTAFGLFGITLIKLFLYDTSELGTLEKTAVFISVGVLLLVVAFLYNKFKDAINSEP